MTDLDEISVSELQRLLGLSRQGLSELVAGKIIVRGKKRGRYQLQASVSGYCAHLREQAAGRGGDTGADVRARLGAAQADLAAEKVKIMRGEVLPTAEVETYWRGKLRSFRNRVLAVPSRVKDLSARQSVTLSSELRACLDELADDMVA